MADAVSVAVSKAVTDMLAGASLSQEFTPERSYADWTLELEDDGLHVDVVAVTTQQTADLETRGGMLNFDCPIDIAVRKRFGTDKQNDDSGRIDIAEVDASMLLVEDIFRLFMPNRLTEFPMGVWRETRIIVAPLTKHLRTLRQFTGIVRVTFRVAGA